MLWIHILSTRYRSNYVQLLILISNKHEGPILFQIRSLPKLRGGIVLDQNIGIWIRIQVYRFHLSFDKRPTELIFFKCSVWKYLCTGTSKLTRPCTASGYLISASKWKVISERTIKIIKNEPQDPDPDPNFLENFWIRISESRRSPMRLYQCGRLWPTEHAQTYYLYWGFLSEDSSMRTPQWVLLREDSSVRTPQYGLSVRTPQWGLLSEASLVRTHQWGLLSEDSSVRRVYEGTLVPGRGRSPRCVSVPGSSIVASCVLPLYKYQGSIW